MPIENTLPIKSSVDDNDYTRVVDEEGNSVNVKNSVLKQYLGEGTATPFLEVTHDGDDTGIVCTEQWSVGKPGAGRESVFGEGDSYGVGLENTTPDGTPVAGSAWHFDYANLSGLTITGATDITTTLASDSGSTTGLFGGTAAGSAILVGSDYTFGGVKAKIDTLGVVDAGDVVAEYLASTSGWVQASFMVTDANFPYEQKGNQIATCSSCSEQWRFGFNPLIGLPVAWDKVTLNINGTDYTKYWAVFRVTDTITTDPIMEQVKLHTNRYEINDDGNTEYFGRGRYPKDILVTKETNNDKNPSNEDLDIAPGITEDRQDNEFQNNTQDGFILRGTLTEGVDTSIPVQVIIDWMPLTNGSGDVELELEAVKTGVGFVYDGTATPVASTPVITSVNGQEHETIRSTFLVNVSTALPGDTFHGSVFRNATTGNADDTYQANIAVIGWRVVGYFWKP